MASIPIHPCLFKPSLITHRHQLSSAVPKRFILPFTHRYLFPNSISPMSDSTSTKNQSFLAPVRPIIIWDTETTGLSPTKNRLIEIALMELPVTAPTPSVYTFSSLIHPPNTAMPRAAARVHGITNPMMQDAPNFAEVWAGVTEYISQVCTPCRGRPILVAHNLRFDLSFLREELKRVGLEVPDWDFVCSLRDVARVLWPGEKASLAALGERFKIINEEAHRALCDVEATANVLEHADRELREAAQKRGNELRPAGSYIRRMIEDAARKRRVAALGAKVVLAEERCGAPTAHSGGGKNRAGLRQFYLTPSGCLWHCDRACERLDTAKVIRRVLRLLKGKFGCSKCVKAEESVRIVEKEGQETENTFGVKERITKKNSPRRTSLRLKQQHR